MSLLLSLQGHWVERTSAREQEVLDQVLYLSAVREALIEQQHKKNSHTVQLQLLAVDAELSRLMKISIGLIARLIKLTGGNI